MYQRYGTEEVFSNQQCQGWWMIAQECVSIKREISKENYVILIYKSKHKKIEGAR